MKAGFKRKIAIAFASIITLACVIAVFILYSASKYRLIILREAQSGEAECYWRIGSAKDTHITPALYQIAVGARPRWLHITNPEDSSNEKSDFTALASSMQFFGTLEGISIANWDADPLRFLEQVGRQPHLTQMTCYRAPITNDITKILIQFPNLQEMSLESPLFTGEGFPRMARLRDVDFSACPINVAGLKSIAESPNLRQIKIADHPNPTSTLRKLIAELKKTYPQIDIWPVDEFPM